MVQKDHGTMTRTTMSLGVSERASDTCRPWPDGTSAPLRLLMVDGVATVRRGMRFLMDAEPDLSVVGEAETTGQALDLAEDLGPDVVITEIKGPALDGLELARSIKQLRPAPGVVFLTQYQSPAYFFEALHCGCEGYILKSASPQELLQGIRCVPLGRRYLDPAMARWLMGEFNRNSGPKPGNNGHRLSSREFQIVELVARGFTNPDIARQLAISVNTARHHRARVMGKLGLHSTAELVRFALNQGLLEA